MKILSLTILMTVLLPLTSLAQQVPALTGPVVDLTGTITTTGEMAQKIRALYSNGQGPQVNILVIERLEGDYTIEQVAHKVFTTWKLGDAKRDDGVLFILATKSRKVRIEVGQGLEGSLTDLHTKRILASIRSELGSGNFSQGLNKGLDAIIANVSQKDAVQGPAPVKQAPHQATSTVKSVEDSQSTDMFFFVLICSLFVFGYFFLVSRQWKEVKREKTLLNQETQDNERLTAKIQAEEKTHKKSIQDVTTSLHAKSKEIRHQTSNAQEELQKAEKVHSQCPQVKLMELKNTLAQEQSRGSTIEQGIYDYERIIKKGLK